MRLNWGAGATGEPGWLNSDLKRGPGIQLPADIRVGLPIESDTFDYIVSVHALQEIAHEKLVDVLRELRRVLRPGGALRLVLPDMDKGVAAYRRGDRDYFQVPDSDWESLGAKLATQLVWYGYSRSLFNWDFSRELLARSGFRAIARSSFGETRAPFPAITALDSRPLESLFVEARK